MKRIWQRYWFEPSGTVRPFLLAHGVLLMLSLDVLLTHLSHGARYTLGGFGVAHFLWLDRIIPQGISPACYSALLLLASGLAFVCAFVGVASLAIASPRVRERLGFLQRLMLLGVVLTYSFAWSSSMLDSYQHHYLLSLFVLTLLFFPKGSLLWEAKATRSNWAFPLLCASLAIVYGYAAFAKLEPAWQSGAALLRVAPQSIQGLKEAWGLSSDQTTPVARWLSQSVPALQATLCVGYVAAPILHRSTWGKRAASGLVFLGVSFHVGSELLGLKIGWFSYYMMWTTLIVFAPAVTVRSFGRLLQRARHLVGIRQAHTHSSSFTSKGYLTPVLVGAATVGLVGTGIVIDIPGTGFAGVVLAVLLLIAWRTAARGAVSSTTQTVGTLLAAGAITWSVTTVASVGVSEVRFDYYRFAGGAYARLGMWDDALFAYKKANLYAPAGKDRLERQREAQQRVDGLPVRSELWSR